MKTIFTKTLLFCIISIHFGYSQTVLPNIISAHTTLLKANSPYYIQTSTLVSDNIILTIEAGVVINMDGVLNIRGKILANGSSSDSIYFNCNNINGPGIRLIKGTADIIETYMEFNFCRIKSKNVGIYGLDRRVKIKNSKIEFCLGDGVFLEKGEIVADSSSFSYNQGNGIKVTDTNPIIRLEYQASLSKIENSMLKKNDLSGLIFGPINTSSYYITKLLFYNNLIDNNQNGISLFGNFSTEIISNKFISNSNYGIGLNTYYSYPISSNSEVSKNIIALNKGAIFLQNFSTYSGNKLIINKNIIYKNSSNGRGIDGGNITFEPHILNLNSSLNLTGNTIIGNDIFNLMQINSGNDSLEVKNNLFSGNVPEKSFDMSFF
ncbi:right-handed parallel beta-helix repeat-containing protein [Lacihabitans lacunae]|uniref:Right-handed parallel beta-helix repeat-containing protein n=1 Tax=Lacihabitans lacunae TaxID=1028214 RepID=A0ABV7YTY6_9BACT